MKIARFLRGLLSVAAFTATFAALTRPSWWLVERVYTKRFSSRDDLQTQGLAVLVQRVDLPDRFSVDFYPELQPQSKLVTSVADNEIDAVNRDLRASISAEDSKYVYFKIVDRGQDYFDVSLETPTTGDFSRKNWYRIQNNAVYPQRVVYLDPFFGVAVAIVPVAGGISAGWGVGYLFRFRQAKTEPVKMA